MSMLGAISKLQQWSLVTNKTKQRRPTPRVTTLRLGGEGGVKRSPLQKCCNISFAYRLGLFLFIEFLDPGKDCVLSTDLFLRSIPSTRRNTETRGYCYVFKCTHTRTCVSIAACTDALAHHCRRTHIGFSTYMWTQAQQAQG